MYSKQFIIFRYSRDVSWVKEYSDNILIYNTGTPLKYDYTILNVENFGNCSNQKYMYKYITDCYINNSLPNCMVFLQDHPFDHCKKEILNKLILNDYFTPLEYYGSTPANGWERRTENGGFLEINNNWYISENNKLHKVICKYKSFDEFMNHYFSNYTHLDWLRFAPGCQYVVPKANIQQYPLEFWRQLMNEINVFGATEAEVMTRALLYILRGDYKLR
jgi:hypothetical protein